jgi:serine/threonine-protein kinase
MQQQSQPSGDLTGQRLFGDYTITRKLGEGGMGAVYLAQQDVIKQEIAVKVLHTRAASSHEIIERFNREARVISLLSHPNIIRVFIFGRTEAGLMYMAMEYVKGTSLREHVQAHGMPDELTSIKIIKQMCSALAEAHDLSIVHRDLKPDNVLLTDFRGEKNFVKILDFGIAKITDTQAEEKQLTQAGIVYGTPEYLSPEQAQAKTLDHRTDLYSLGVMLYEMIAGQVPFQAASAVQILTAHVFNEPPKPSEMSSKPVSPTMENIILKAMAKDPDARFQSALEMFRALEMREREILQERKLGSDANYVPGGELTGMFQAVGTDPAFQAPQSNPGFQAPQSNPGFQAPQSNPGFQAPQSNPNFQPQPTLGTQTPQKDTTRQLIMMVIFIAVLVLIFLIAVIVWLMAK